MHAAGQGWRSVSMFALAWSVGSIRQVLMQPAGFDWMVRIRANVPSHSPSVWIEWFSGGHTMKKVNGTLFKDAGVSQGR